MGISRVAVVNIEEVDDNARIVSSVTSIKNPPNPPVPTAKFFPPKRKMREKNCPVDSILKRARVDPNNKKVLPTPDPPQYNGVEPSQPAAVGSGHLLYLLHTWTPIRTPSITLFLSRLRLDLLETVGSLTLLLTILVQT